MHVVHHYLMTANVLFCGLWGEKSERLFRVDSSRSNSSGDTLMDWLHPLHNGEAFGLLPLLALVTGFIRWRHKVQPQVRKQ